MQVWIIKFTVAGNCYLVPWDHPNSLMKLSQKCLLPREWKVSIDYGPLFYTTGLCVHVYWAISHGCLLSQYSSWPRPEARPVRLYSCNAGQSLSATGSHCSGSSKRECQEYLKKIYKWQGWKGIFYISLEEVQFLMMKEIFQVFQDLNVIIRDFTNILLSTVLLFKLISLGVSFPVGHLVLLNRSIISEQMHTSLCISLIACRFSQGSRKVKIWPVFCFNQN